MGYNAMQALGSMAEGAGSFFGTMAVEKRRTEALAQARAQKLEDREYDENKAYEASVLRQQHENLDGGMEDIEAELDRKRDIIKAKDKEALRQKKRVESKEDGDVGMPPSYRMTHTLGKQLTSEMKSLSYHASREALDKMEFAVERGDHMSDAAMIFYFMKTLDPTSVVRESEFKTVQDAVSFMTRAGEAGIPIPSKALQIYQSFTGQGRLTPDQRGQILAVSRNAFAAKQERADQIMRGYESQAEKYGLDPIEMGLHKYRSSVRKPAVPSMGAAGDISDEAANSYLESLFAPDPNQ